jgi:cell division protein FtsB
MSTFDTMKKLWNSIPAFFKNKYIMTFIIFILWLSFFDQNNWIAQMQYQFELNKLDNEREFYEEEIKIVTQDLKELQTNPKSLEKFAREKYLMKKDNEEVFVLIEED